jgi:Tfp pilus assembly protein PilX
MVRATAELPPQRKGRVLVLIVLVLIVLVLIVLTPAKHSADESNEMTLSQGGTS